jgi:hypothetical protein
MAPLALQVQPLALEVQQKTVCLQKSPPEAMVLGRRWEEAQQQKLVVPLVQAAHMTQKPEHGM